MARVVHHVEHHPGDRAGRGSSCRRRDDRRRSPTRTSPGRGSRPCTRRACAPTRSLRRRACARSVRATTPAPPPQLREQRRAGSRGELVEIRQIDPGRVHGVIRVLGKDPRAPAVATRRSAELPGARMTTVNDFNRSLIEEFRANDGKVGGHFEGAPLLLLTTTGAKSGREHTTPVVSPARRRSRSSCSGRRAARRPTRRGTTTSSRTRR